MRGYLLVAALAGCGRLAFDSLHDAAEGDATEDGGPIPLLVSGQAAEIALGQPDLMTGAVGTVAATSLQGPEGVTTDGTRLWVHDNFNRRILMWSPVPTSSAAPADLVLGQADMMSTSAGGTSQTTFSENNNISANVDEYDGAATDGVRLYVANHAAARVMIWDPPPTSDGAPMQRVLGADNFTTCCSANPAARFGDPTGIWTDGSKLIVGDIHGHRVMIWSTVPAVNGEPASVVVGRPDFTYVGSTPAASAATLDSPHGVHVAGGKLFVADTGNNRILVWNQVPTTNGVPADFVIGQPDLTSDAPNAGGTPSAATLNNPTGMITIGDHLVVTDRRNHRVLVYTPIPTAMGASASIVLGQPDFTTTTLAPPAPDRFNRPVWLAATATHLWVSDPGNHRVVAFALGQ